jgi:acylphosphatase
MERIEAVISGRVQMVMFRDFATRKARGLGLTGEVKNLPDGTVRLIAEGERAALEQYIEKLHKGSVLSHVDAVQVAWKPAQGSYRSFDIAYE